MPCTILCAADLWGTKVNYELPFPHPPSHAELQAKIEHVFVPEHGARRPASVPASQGFVVERMQTFDERAQQWVDLLTPAQLSDYSQIYLFQKENEHHREVQSKIPPPVPTPAAAAAAAATTTSPSTVAAEQSDAAAASRAVVAPPAAAAAAPVPATVPAAAAAVPAPAPVGLEQLPASQHGRTIPTFEKQRGVYDELDAKKARAVDQEAFLAAFQRLRVDQSTTNVAALFEKADTNKDGLVSYEEWVRFSDIYPALLDALYFRSKDFWADSQQQQEIEKNKVALDGLRDREKEVRLQAMQAQAETSTQEQKLSAQTAAAQDAQAREREAKSVLEACHDDTERGRAELRERVTEQTQQKDTERLKQVAVLEATREVEVVQRRLAAHEAEFQKAEETLREMERRVAEQRQEVERHHAAVDRVRGELATAQGAEHLAGIVLGEAQKDSQAAADRVAVSEADMAARQEREREATAVHRDSQSDTARQLAKRDMEDRELQLATERAAARRAAEDEAARAVTEQEALVQKLEHNNMELNVNRRQVEEEERPLLEQEFNLRRMREALEENEARLRTDHRTFHSAHGRGDTAADSPAPTGLPPAPTLAQATAALTAAAAPIPLVGSPYRPLPVMPVAVPVAAMHPAALPTIYSGAQAAPALSALPPPTRGASLR